MWSGGPSIIDPFQLAKKGAHLSGALPLKAMPRLADLCARTDGGVEVDLRFERGEQDGLCVMYGSVRTSLALVCQRCLEEMTLDLRAAPRLMLLRPGERADLEQEAETLVVEQSLSLAQVIEDELLLVMPMIPMHDVELCPARNLVKPPADQSPRRSQAKRNPFAVLKELKRKD